MLVISMMKQVFYLYPRSRLKLTLGMCNNMNVCHIWLTFISSYSRWQQESDVLDMLNLEKCQHYQFFFCFHISCTSGTLACWSDFSWLYFSVYSFSYFSYFVQLTVYNMPIPLHSSSQRKRSYNRKWSLVGGMKVEITYLVFVTVGYFMVDLCLF